MEYDQVEVQLIRRIAMLRQRETSLIDELGMVAEERAKREDQWMRLREGVAERLRDDV